MVELKRFLVCLPIIKEYNELFLRYTTLVAERLCGGHAWQGGASVVGVCVAEETTTAAGGTNPTGMHSCLK